MLYYATSDEGPAAENDYPAVDTEFDWSPGDSMVFDRPLYQVYEADVHVREFQKQQPIYGNEDEYGIVAIYTILQSLPIILIILTSIDNSTLHIIANTHVFLEQDNS